MLFADLLSLHFVTFLMFFILVSISGSTGSPGMGHPGIVPGIPGYSVLQDPWAPSHGTGYCRPDTCPVYLGIPKDVSGQVVAVLDIPRGQIVVVMNSCRWMHICTLIQKQPSPDRQETGHFLGAFSCWQHPVTTPVRRRLDSTKSLGFPPVLKCPRFPLNCSTL